MENTRQIIYLAALLHDIGKFYQRADKTGVRNSEELSDHIKGLESTYCPLFDGKYSHKHVLWTAQFLEDHKSVFTELLGEGERLLFEAAVSHHRADGNPYHQIVRLADHLSSGMDRTKAESLKEGQEENKIDNFKNKRLLPMLALLGENTTSEFSWPIHSMSLGKDTFPQKNSELNESGYDVLWKEFVEEFIKLNRGDINTFVHSLQALLLKFTTCIPSSTIHLPDVSLYDHLQSTAAYAICLYDYMLASGNENPAQLEIEQFLLIGGDISGIQQFIYDIVSKKAAQNLKGRSFYLQLLSDTIIFELLQELNLPYSNVVYASGGGFYILAPNTPIVEQKLGKYTEKITQQLFSRHENSLSIAIDRKAFNGATVISEVGLKDVWRDLAINISVGKTTKYKSLLKENPQAFFEPIRFDHTAKRDAISGQPIKGKAKILDNSKDDALYLSELNDSILQLGGQLRNTDYLVLASHRIQYWDTQEVFSISPLDSNTTWYLFSREKHEKLKEKLKGTADFILVSELNSFNIQMAASFGTRAAAKILLYGGNDFPCESDGSPKSFNELAEYPGSGYKKLGVLRMDVDSLGNLFKQGFKKNTFSRYSTLSRNLDFFFKGYLNTIWKNNSDYNSYSTIIYSGGDDLFILGYWGVVIRFAKQIHEEFNNWCCNNKAISISGGISIIDPKFPIAKAALLAGGAEESAKKHICQGKEKNALTIFETPLNWDEEMPYVQNLKTEMVSLIGDRQEISRALLGKIGSFHYMSERKTEGGYKNISWKWLMAYDFARTIDRNKSKTAHEFIRNLKIDAYANSMNRIANKSNYETLSLMRVAARWAELEIR